MTKYNEQFKLSLVQLYLMEKRGYVSIANEHGVDPSMLRRWVSLYQSHDLAGLAKKHSYYDAGFKMKVLEHMWKHRLSYRAVAAEFNIRSIGCIGQWERSYHSGDIESLTPHSRGRAKQMKKDTQISNPSTGDLTTREDLQAEVDYLKKLQALVQEQQRAIARKKRK